MKIAIPFPAEKISWFQEKVSFDEDSFNKLKGYSSFFIERKSQFSDYFYEYFSRIEETKFILSHEERRGHIKKTWEEWFETFFNDFSNHVFLTWLWKSGLRHVEINIDHRFITLGYSVLRQFCHEITRKHIDPAKQETVISTIDKMIDFCLMVETHAFIEATAQCDMEVIRGISHQVRNPLTVIGGNILRLMKHSEKGTSGIDIPQICHTITEESQRLESMVSDAILYSDMYQSDAKFSVIPVKTLIHDAMERISAQRKAALADITLEINVDDLNVQGDAQDLETMFFYLLQNLLESLDPEGPYLRISSIYDDPSSPFVQIEVFNKGAFLTSEELDNVFIPFYSAKPHGTGFGLAIARLAARKSLGDLYLKVIEGEGTKCVIKLPVPLEPDQPPGDY